VKDEHVRDEYVKDATQDVAKDLTPGDPGGVSPIVDFLMLFVL